jgi:oligo-1,6-glucosidase
MFKSWFREGVVYQIYPRSFNDSNHDGVGDLLGIIDKIPYLKTLGVDIVWLSPVYASPNDDNGYDISDYRAIQPEFGTMEDMELLIKLLHEANIKIVMDLVVNHTSDEHPWFVKSAQNDPNYRDFYHWKPTKGNWTSFFGGEAWSYHPERKEYYLHLFSKKQPDLNWDNPAVREAVQDICRFWLDKGIDGFRCDVINIIAKEDGLPNGRFSVVLQGKEHYLNHPKIHGYLQELKEKVLSNYDCFTVGETVFATPDIAAKYQDEKVRELDMMFQFDHMAADCHFVKWFPKPFHPINLKKPLSKWQLGLNGRGWNTLYLENHDQARSISRFGHPDWHDESAKMLATLIYFQQGTPFIYQGQEIGMTNAHFTELSQYRDIESLNIYKLARKTLHYSHKKTMKLLAKASRDNARTPMQWNSTNNAGFTDGTPWLSVNPNHIDYNVEKAINDPDSIFHYFRKIIELRKQLPVVIYGDYHDLCFHHRRLYAYHREWQNEELIILCNFSKKPLEIPKSIHLSGYELILNNVLETQLVMSPYEARVYYKKIK